MGAFLGGSIVNISEEDNSDEYLSSDSDEEESIVSSDEFEAEEDEDIENGVDDIRVNLDITAMIAYVSAMTNGRYGFQFQEKILMEQSEWERQRKILKTPGTDPVPGVKFFFNIKAQNTVSLVSLVQF